MEWNFDINKAPKSRYEIITRKRQDGKEVNKTVVYPAFIISASSCGKVIKTSWLPDVERWEFYTKDNPPIAWKEWPEHPHK